jgi:hypothetical protein
MDSGASKHLCCDRSKVYNFEAFEIPKRCSGIHGFFDIVGIGKVDIQCLGQDNIPRRIQLSKVQYSPQAFTNLLSIRALDQKGMTFTIKQGRFVGTLDGAEIMVGDWRMGGYMLQLDCENKALVSRENEALLWHSRLGHLNFNTLRKISTSVTGVPRLAIDENPFCEACTVAKLHRMPSRKETVLCKARLELIYVDIVVMEIESAGGARYGAGLTDDCTRYSWNMNLKKRSDFPKAFMEWAALVENETGCKIKRLRSDGAGENTSDEFVDWLRSKGIRHEVPPAHTSEMNAVAERSHRTLVEYARAMSHEADLPS